MRKVLIIGASSAIAQATARLLAESGDTLFLVARSQHKLNAIADDLIVRGASTVYSDTLDALDFDRHEAVINSAIDTLDGLDLVLIAHGSLPDQTACELSFVTAQKEFNTNALSTISLLTLLANYFESKRQGTIAVISSVAGDRGRQSNYIYGTTKATVTVFLQGLRNRLHESGVKVITIKPGFVDTPMTADFSKGLLWETPQRIAKGLLRAVDKQKDVVYLPWFWRYIMWVIRMTPETVFKRLKL